MTRITQRLNASPAAVYRGLVDRDAVQRWMVPDGMTSHVHQFDARVGGHGRFLELVPGERVVQAVEFESDDPAMLWRLSLAKLARLVEGVSSQDPS